MLHGLPMLATIGAPAVAFLRALGRVGIIGARTLQSARRMNAREFLRASVDFGTATLPLALVVAAITGAMAVLQTSLYVERFGARGFLGWAAGYAILWEFGPLVLGLLAAARIGARNAAELAALKVGGQLEGLEGVSLDPFALLVAPRIFAMCGSLIGLSLVTFLVAIVFEALAATITLGIPVAAFLQSLAGLLSGWDVLAGVVKTVVFGIAMALVSVGAGLSARGGARAVGQAAARSVVQAAGCIFLLDFVLTGLLDRVLG